MLEQTDRASVRERDLPAHVVVYYVIALALYMRSSYREVLRCLLEGVQWLLDPSAAVKVAGKSGISQARSRWASEPVKTLYDTVVAPIAEKRTKGAWYRRVATGQSGRQHAGCRRHSGERSRPLGVRAPAEGPALSPRSGLWRCWRMGPTCCGPRTWTICHR